MVKKVLISISTAKCLALTVYCFFVSKSVFSCSNFSLNFTITPSKSCGIPIIITLQNTTTGNSQNVATYTWKINGNIHSSVVGKNTIKFNYSVIDTITIKLFAKDTGSASCYDSITKTYIVKTGIPKMEDVNGNFSYKPLWLNCIASGPDTFGFVLKVADSLKNFKILWGDSKLDSGTLLLPSGGMYHKYSNLNVFNVTIISKKGSCNDTFVNTLTNEKNPVASLIGPPSGTNTVCLPLSGVANVRFVNNSSYGSPNTNFLWDNGVNNIIKQNYLQNKDTIFFKYLLGGLCGLTVKLTAINQCGSSTATWSSINISSKNFDSIVLVNPTNCDLSKNFEFKNIRKNNYCGISSARIKYDWGDGTNTGWQTNNSNQFKKYAAYGKYTVTLYDSNLCGINKVTFTFVIDSVPVPKILSKSGINNGCKNDKLTFVANYKGTVTSRSWNFGDPGSGSNSSTDSVASHVFSKGGNFLVVLTISNNCGTKKDTFKVKINEHVKLIMNKIGKVCAPDSVLFSNSSIEWFVGSTKYKWIFPNGTVSTKKNPSKIFIKNKGNYNVLLIGEDSCGIDTIKQTFIVDSLPSTKIAVSPSVGCAPLTVQYKDVSGFKPLSRTVNFGNPSSGSLNTSTDSIKSHQYNKKGGYTITCENKNNCGTGKDSVKITIGEKAIANFQINNFICLPDSITIQNNTIETYINKTQYYWYLNNSLISVVKNPNKTAIKKIGKYFLKLVVADSCGKDSITKTFIADSIPTPKIILKNTTQNKCAVFNAEFRDSSIAFNKVREWEFGDPSSGSNNKSTDSVATHKYSNTGTFTIKLKISNNCKTIYDSVNIKIGGKAIASFQNLNSGCSPLTLKFTNTTNEYYIGSTTYKWIFPDGTNSTAKNPNDKIFTTPGTFNVMLITTDSCGNDTATRTFTVNPKPSVNAKVLSSIFCEKNVILLKHSTNAKTNIIKWMYNDGKNDSTFTNDTTKTHSHIFDSAKVYSIKIVASDSKCADTTNLTINVKQLPIANFSANKNAGCGTLAALFTNSSLHNLGGSSAGLNYNWNFGNGKFSNSKDTSSYFVESTNKDSTFYVKLTVENTFRCKDSITKNVIVYAKPKVTFNLNTLTGCGPLKIVSNNKSVSVGSGNILNYSWNISNSKFGNTKDSSWILPASNYKDSFYTIKLICTNNYGCKDSVIKNIQVYPLPKALFTLNTKTGCFPLSVAVTNKSYPKDTGSIDIMNFSYTINYNYYSNSKHLYLNFKDTFSKNIIYKVLLTAYSEHSCIDTFSEIITMYPKPKTSFVPDKIAGCEVLTVNYLNKSINNDSNYWNLGNGIYSNNFNTSSSYTGLFFKDTHYFVQLFTKSKFNCKGDSVLQKITVFGRPKADFDQLSDSNCLNTKILFLNKSLDASKYIYYFGNGKTTSVVNPTQVFPKSYSPYNDSIYLNTLIAIGKNGCADTTYKKLTILPYPKPIFSFTTNGICTPVTAIFTNNSKNAINYKWYFGDGYSSSITSPTHVFTNNGLNDSIYWVRLFAFSKDCVDTTSLKIIVNRKPKSQFTVQPLKNCDSVASFNGGSLNHSAFKYLFGDGSFGNIETTTHNYKPSIYNDTQYFPKGIAYHKNGCSDTIQKTVLIPQKLIVQMKHIALDFCPPQKVSFNHLCNGAVIYYWNFGDGYASASANTQHTFTTPGIYFPKLTAINKNGCIDSITNKFPIVIREKPKANFNFSPTNFRIPGIITSNFTDQSSFINPITYSWDFGDKIGKSNIKNPTYTYKDSGNFTVQLIVDNNACKDTIKKILRIEPPYPIANFKADSTAKCMPATIVFTNLCQFYDSMIFYFGNGLWRKIKTKKDTIHFVYTDAAKFSVSVAVFGPGGTANKRIVDYITVYPKPEALFYRKEYNKFMNDAIYSAESFSKDAIKTSWFYEKKYINKQYFKDTTSVTKYNFIDSGFYTITLKTESINNCINYNFDTIRVIPETQLFIPSAFSPFESKTINDSFGIDKPWAIDRKDFYFYIYNRWGEKIFETSNPFQKWDGKFMGKFCPSGIYVFLIKGKFITGKPIGKETYYPIYNHKSTEPDNIDIKKHFSEKSSVYGIVYLIR